MNLLWPARLIGDLPQRAAEQSLRRGELAERRGRGVAAVLQVEVASLVEFYLDGVDKVVTGEPPDRPAAGEPMIHPDIEPSSSKRFRNQPI